MSDSPRSALLQVRHVTGFNYDGMADSSYNEARMTPVASAHQEVVDASLRVTPSPALMGDLKALLGPGCLGG